MRISACLVFFLMCYGISTAQRDFNDSIAASRNKITKNAMLTLGGWAALNIASGFVIAGTTHGEAHYAWRMNAYWNLVNFGLAGMGYLGVRKMAARKFGFADNYKAQHAIEKLYVFNAGLDLAYLAGGAYLRERGNAHSPGKTQDQLKGYGTSIIIQGGFLLLMDGFLITLHHKNTNRMDDRLRHWELNGGPSAVRLTYNF